MGKRDPRIDAYIAGAADFAKPILAHLRTVVHSVSPDIDETMKWSFPHFEYKGILCSMASFKKHCALGFWKASLILDENGRSAEQAMGQFGRITSIDELPSDKILTGYIRKAMELNATGVKAPPRAKLTKQKNVVMPTELTSALKKNRKALAAFDGFSPSKRKEYAEWIGEAKSDATRDRRVEQAIQWISEGKGRNWKYEKC